MVKSRSFIATPPGATIKEQLLDRGLSQKEFSVRMGMSEKHISKLINGEVQLTPDVAVRLEMVLGIPAKFWNKLESTYREKLVKANAENDMDADKELEKNYQYVCNDTKMDKLYRKRKFFRETDEKEKEMKKKKEKTGVIKKESKFVTVTDPQYIWGPCYPNNQVEVSICITFFNNRQ